MSSSISTSMGIREWIMLFTLSVLWGGSFFFIELAVAELSTLTVVLFRVALAAIVLWLYIILARISVPKSFAIWGSFLIMGLLNNVLPFSLIVWGQTYIASGLASIFNAATPLFTVLVASSFLQDEKLTKNKLIGVLLGFLGAVIMIGLPAVEDIGVNILAQFAVLGAALSYAFASVYGRRFKAQKINPVVSAVGQLSASALVLAPVALLSNNSIGIVIPSAQVILAVVALAVLSTAVAYVWYFKILASAGATNLLLVTFLIPVTAILLGTLVLGEKLDIVHMAGMGVISIGLIAIDGRLYQSMKRSTISKVF